MSQVFYYICTHLVVLNFKHNILECFDLIYNYWIGFLLQIICKT